MLLDNLYVEVDVVIISILNAVNKLYIFGYLQVDNNDSNMVDFHIYFVLIMLVQTMALVSKRGIPEASTFAFR